jgi:hypothetical protein
MQKLKADLSAIRNGGNQLARAVHNRGKWSSPGGESHPQGLNKHGFGWALGLFEESLVHLKFDDSISVI